MSKLPKMSHCGKEVDVRWADRTVRVYVISNIISSYAKYYLFTIYVNFF